MHAACVVTCITGLSLIAITSFCLHPHFVVTLGKYLKLLVIVITIQENILYIDRQCQKFKLLWPKYGTKTPQMNLDGSS